MSFAELPFDHPLRRMERGESTPSPFEGEGRGEGLSDSPLRTGEELLRSTTIPSSALLSSASGSGAGGPKSGSSIGDQLLSEAKNFAVNQAGSLVGTMLGGDGKSGLGAMIDGGCFGSGPDVGAMMSGLGFKALDQLAGAAFSKLTAIKDSDPAALAVAKHLADKFGRQALDALMSPEGLMKKLTDLVNGAKSEATVPIGLADQLDVDNMVFVNGLPATRMADIAITTAPPDKCTFIMGNDTVILNGQWAAGEIHIAIGELGTVATPLKSSPNVLMGPKTAMDLSLVPKQQSPPKPPKNGPTADKSPESRSKPVKGKAGDPETLGKAGAEKGRELIEKHKGDLQKASNDIIGQRRGHFDRALAKKIAERDGLSSAEENALYRQLHDEKNLAFRASEVAKLSTEERDSLHDPVLTNADRYVEALKQIDKCGTEFAEFKFAEYDRQKKEAGTSDATDNDGRSSSPLGIGQTTADKEAINDAVKKGASKLPKKPVACILQSAKDITHSPHWPF